MKQLSSTELRSMFLDFFHLKKHAIIEGASLVPTSDSDVLFTTAGMLPLMPCFTGNRHVEGRRLANVQKVIRTGAIDLVGTDSYCTFFELLGNWSLGDYYKETAIQYAYEFLTNPLYLDMPPERLFFTCFADKESTNEIDIESQRCWIAQGVDKDHIFMLPCNWKGPYGSTGICGTNTKVFYDTGKERCGLNCKPTCSCGKYLEIWDIVFFDRQKNKDGVVVPLKQFNVDTGMGLERVAALLQGANSVYEIDSFSELVQLILINNTNLNINDEKIKKYIYIVADHIRCATFILADDARIAFSNSGRGYVLRRVVRRAIRYLMLLELPLDILAAIATKVIEQFSSIYPELKNNKEFILDSLLCESERFFVVINRGLKEFKKIQKVINGDKLISGLDAFKIYTTYGFPIEFMVDLAQKSGFSINLEEYQEQLNLHKK